MITDKAEKAKELTRTATDQRVLANRLASSGQHAAAARCRERAQEYDRRAATVKENGS